MMWKKCGALVLATAMTLSAVGIPALAAEETPTRAQSAQQAIELAAQYGQATSVQYALWEDGEITLSGHTGTYSRTENRALTEGNLYGVGSVSKVYTTAAVMKLVEEGKVVLDEPVITYLPTFKMDDERYGDITVRMLLNHSSGLMGSSMNNAMLFNDPDETSATDDLLSRLATQRLKADPGAYSVYCNDGFTLAELVVEQASGMDFTAFLHQYILEPAGLEKTYTPLDTFDRDLLAKTYLGDDTRAMPTESLGIIGAGGIYATAEDLATFGGKMEDILTQKSLDAMANDESARGMWPKDSEEDALAYGLGWDNVRMYPFQGSNIQALVKGGDTQYYHAGLITLPEYDMAVAVLSSGGLSTYNELAGARILMDALAERGVEVADTGALPETKPASMPASMTKFSGRYGSSTMVVTVSIAADGTLTMQLPAAMGGTAQTYQYHSDGSFRDENGILIRFVTEKNGRTYLYQKAYSNVPGLVTVPTAAYAYERLPQNEVIEEVQKAWDARQQTIYLLLNEKYTSQLYTISGVFGAVQTTSELPGYVGSNKLVDKDNARAYVQIPGTAGRDQSDISFRTQRGVEYLSFGDYLFMDSAAADPLYLGAGASSTIQDNGNARWYQVGQQAGKELQVSIEGKGGFCVYGADLTLKAASWTYGDTGAVLPEGGWIVFAGNPGTRFDLSVAGA